MTSGPPKVDHSQSGLLTDPGFRCRANSAHVRQSGLDAGPDLQGKVPNPFEGVPSALGSGTCRCACRLCDRRGMRAAQFIQSSKGKLLSSRSLGSRRGVGLSSGRQFMMNTRDSMKTTTYLDHIRHCKTVAGSIGRIDGPTEYLS